MLPLKKGQFEPQELNNSCRTSYINNLKQIGEIKNIDLPSFHNQASEEEHLETSNNLKIIINNAQIIRITLNPTTLAT